LREIAEEYNIAWDSSKTEAEFRKNHEDLLVIYQWMFVSSLLDVKNIIHVI